MIDMWGLFLSLILSGIGLGYFAYGKKEADIFSLACGVLLMIFPYFITNIYIMLIIGLILVAIPKFIKA